MASSSSATSTSSATSQESGSTAKGSTEIYQFKVTMGKKAPIWRRVQIPVSNQLTFRKLHQILNRAMGWDSWRFDYHMWEFKIGEIGIGDGLAGFDDVMKGSTLVKTMLKNPGITFTYLYDFGASHMHKVILEDILEGNLDHPVCIRGRQACPPEDGTGPDKPFNKEAINRDLKTIL